MPRVSLKEGRLLGELEGVGRRGGGPKCGRSVQGGDCRTGSPVAGSGRWRYAMFPGAAHMPSRQECSVLGEALSKRALRWMADQGVGGAAEGSRRVRLERYLPRLVETPDVLIWI